MKIDGNLVVNNGKNEVIWSSNTLYQGSYLILRDDGNLVVYGNNSKVRWSIWYVLYALFLNIIN